MITSFQLLLLLLATLSCFGGETRLECEQEACAEDTKQVGCLPFIRSKEFATSCTSQPYFHKYIAVNGNLRGVIVQYVNVLRNSVASGLFNMTAAARMPIVTWDDDLAAAARVLVHECNPDHNLCVNTEKYQFVVTVEVKASYKSRHPRILSDVRNIMLPIWFKDVYGCHMDDDGRILPTEEGLCVGHYIPLIQDHGNRMGCAIRLSENEDPALNSTVTLICNLSRASVNGMPPYKVGTVPGEDCETGRSLLYENLCRRQEEIDNNFVPPAPDQRNSPSCNC